MKRSGSRSSGEAEVEGVGEEDGDGGGEGLGVGDGEGEGLGVGVGVVVVSIVKVTELLASEPSLLVLPAPSEKTPDATETTLLVSLLASGV